MKLKYKFVIQKIEGSSFAVTTGRDIRKFNGVVKLNDAGCAVFELLQKEITEQELFKTLESRYEEVDRKDIMQAIERFRKAGILQ